VKASCLTGVFGVTLITTLAVPAGLKAAELTQSTREPLGSARTFQASVSDHGGGIDTSPLRESVSPRAGAIPPNQRRRVAAASQTRTASLRIPAAFEANIGQADPAVRFVARGPDHTVFITPNEAVLVLAAPARRSGKIPTALVVSRNTVVRLTAVGGSANPAVVGEEQLSATVNYIRGSNPANWHASVPIYSKVREPNIYPGIDLLYHGNSGRIEADFVVAAGADPRQIRLRFAGAERLKVDASGALVLRAGGATLRLQRPDIYQEIHGRRRPVAGDWVRRGTEEASFRVADYDRARQLVIDPLLVF
jgi:hypothetical protein